VLDDMHKDMLKSYPKGFVMYMKQKYEECLQMAEYYRWKAIRGHGMAGNNPLTGMPWKKFNVIENGAQKAANIALAKYWLTMARKFRQNQIKVA
jgi:hypothetical protein